MSSTRIGYMFGSKSCTALKIDAEPSIDAVKRSLSRKLKCDITLWYQERGAFGCEIYNVKWFDAKAEVYREELVVI